MEKQKRWQLFLIIAVILLTVYNILPTVFFYTKPLKKPIDEKRAAEISLSIMDRVDRLEGESEEWLHAFCKNLGIKPLTITLNPQEPQFVKVAFKTPTDAELFRKYLPRAGTLIPFVAAQLSLYDDEIGGKIVTVERHIPIHFNPAESKNYFEFAQKWDAQGKPTELYRALVSDRVLQLGNILGGVSENAGFITNVIANPQGPQTQEALEIVAHNLLSFTRVFGDSSVISKNYFSSCTQVENTDREQMIAQFVRVIEQTKDKLKLERIGLQQESQNLLSQGEALDTVKQQRLDTLLAKEKTLSSLSSLINKNQSAFASGKAPLSEAALRTQLQEGKTVLSLTDHNPFFSEIEIDWAKDSLSLKLYPDLLAYIQQLEKSQNALRSELDQLLYNEIATVSRQSGETIAPQKNHFVIALNALQNSSSFLAMRLAPIAVAETVQLKEIITNTWHPTHPDLTRSAFPIWDYETYEKLPPEQQRLGLVIYAPSTHKKRTPGFKTSSLYVLAKGLDKIVERIQSAPQSDASRQFLKDFNDLRQILQQNGYAGYPGSYHRLSKHYLSDFIFEKENYFQTVLKATRENFNVHGSKRYAILEFTDVEQRILTENKIGDRVHEDLLKWRDDYLTAQLNLKGATAADVPPPTKNVYWSNFKLSCLKYFRGDDRKILHWGLDLSGGKTVQIELRDTNNRLVTSEADIKQGINELYQRVNKMGVSEVSIRQEGNYISLDFPGSQGLSATELVKASTMYFHVVNEKFTPKNPQLGDAVNRFLQEVWNEALVTGRKSVEDLNLIAWRHLYGEGLNEESAEPRSLAAKALYDQGLRLPNPADNVITGQLDQTFSQIGVFRGTDFSAWQGQTHPLLVVFRNYALEGSNLENVRASYDPSQGNYLSFGISGSRAKDALFAWSSQFSKDKVMGTPNEAYSHGSGWRMAVILNGSIISSPTLNDALRSSAMITGSFTQREVNQLEADLKAGSLSFTPHILSEKNVSPELGSHERTLGVAATGLALLLAFSAMVGYYRFGGFVAMIAVFFNLLIMWATLQNLQATMTLAGIAGIILTLGMAVDANVLVFERIREEFAVSGRIASAVHAGYRKAFSAIFDSNVTTLIAAVILLNFDAGPIKGLALTLIIGIVSSLFTALFMTRYYFSGWVQNPKNQLLKMSEWITPKNFNFLKYTKVTVVFSAIVILAGGYLLFAQRQTIMGMDFTGGFAVTLEVKEKPGMNYRHAIEQALIKQGAKPQDFQIRELTPSNHMRIFLSTSLEQPGRPFFGMPLAYDLKEVSYPFENNPKLVWIVRALNQSNLALTQESLSHLDRDWTQVSGQISNSMRNSALIGLMLALACILLYITVRFEFKYAISATLCLAHDVLFTLAFIGILHLLRVPVQIDLNTVAALMTIVGYSLNDTIIVFDRIREDVRLMKKRSFAELINQSLNSTLSRTLMTSGTTLLVLLPLVLLGGSTIFGFALVMSIGVIFGTLSSLFIAAPLMKYFHDRELQKKPTVEVLD